MPDFNHILDAAIESPGKIVLPEGEDPRVIEAARQSFDRGTAKPILIGNISKIKAVASDLSINLDGLTLVNPDADKNKTPLAAALFEKRKHKGMTENDAEQAVLDPLHFACMMVEQKLADGCVAGAIYPTATVVRTALQLVGKHPDYSFVSSFFIMLMNQSFHPVKDLAFFADCALVVEPDKDQLAEIAIVTGESARKLLGIDPQIAMLSFSTAASAKHKQVDKVVEATRKARSMRPDWRIIGDVQLDAAVIPEILASKAPDMATEEPANILIFPSLEAGNIGYKICERFGGVEAIGPVLQGLARPVNDLSRGCKTQDIENIIAVTSVQSQA